MSNGLHQYQANVRLLTNSLRMLLQSWGLLFLCFAGAVAWACPFCDAPATTLGQQLSTAHVAVLAKWISAEKPDPNTFAEGTTTYEVIASAGTGASKVPQGHKFTVPRYNSGIPDAEFLLFASLEEDRLSWGLPSPVSRKCWEYLIQSPPRDSSPQTRLPYYLKALEHSDPDIAMDAYGEFATVPYEDLRQVIAHLPREQIRAWLTDPNVIPTRRGLYGLMLGLCGGPDDARFLKEIIWQQPEEPRLGIDGMMAGYLLLQGKEGLQQLTERKLADPAAPVHEVYAMLQTLRFLWEYGQDVVDADALRESLRELLKHPEFAGLVILDLARWNDWELMDQLMASYGQAPFDDPHARQSIVRFLLAAEKDARPHSDEKDDSPAATPVVDYAAKARSYLKELRQRDPKTVKYVERYSFD